MTGLSVLNSGVLELLNGARDIQKEGGKQRLETASGYRVRYNRLNITWGGLCPTVDERRLRKKKNYIIFSNAFISGFVSRKLK